MEKLDNGAIGLGSFRLVRPMKNGLMAEQVVIQVREMIRQGSLKPGDRLPPERELAKRLGISRASLRHGLRALTAIGVLTSRHGSGTYIAEGPPALDDISFTIPAGSVFGIVGRSGSGKTTLTRLICGLYPIQQGLLRIGGYDAR